MLGRILVAARADVVQVVVGRAVGRQFVGIVVGGLHVVIDVLIEATKGVAVVQLVVEARAPLGVWIACRGLFPVADGPQRVGKDGLLEVATAPPLVVGSEEVGKQLQTPRAVGQVDALVVLIAASLAAP